MAGSGLGSLGGGRGGGRRGRSLRGGLLYWGFSLLEFWGLAWGEKWDNGTFWRGGRGAWLFGDGGDGGRRGDNFAGGGELEGEVQHCSASTQGLQVEGCWTPLLPEVGSMVELVLDELVGCCRPRASWPRRRRHPVRSWQGEGLSLTPHPRFRLLLCNTRGRRDLLKKVIKLVSLVV